MLTELEELNFYCSGWGNMPELIVAFFGLFLVDEIKANKVKAIWVVTKSELGCILICGRKNSNILYKHVLEPTGKTSLTSLNVK